MIGRSSVRARLNLRYPYRWLWGMDHLPLDPAIGTVGSVQLFPIQIGDGLLQSVRSFCQHPDMPFMGLLFSVRIETANRITQVFRREDPSFCMFFLDRWPGSKLPIL